MAFDMGFDFRASAGYVTDPAFGVPVTGQSYPNTYTNSNGDSINAGWTTGVPTFIDNGSTSKDVRIAGDNENVSSSAVKTFQVDLGSGSGPGAATFGIDLAIGDYGASDTYSNVEVKDSATSLLSFSGSISVGATWLDATGTLQTPGSGVWPGTIVTKSFATTTCTLNVTANAFAGVSHFRLTLQTAASQLRSLMLLGVGA